MNQMETSQQQIENGFRKLLGRAPSQEAILELVHIKEALGLRGDDPLWLILYALQYYQESYKAIPAEIAAALARVEAIRSSSPVGSPEGWAARILAAWGGRKAALFVLGALVVALGLGGVIGRLSVDAPARQLAALNQGGQLLLTCFNGTGRLEQRPDGRTYCFPVSPDGKAFGYVVK